jgi:hypothetical protein
MQDHHPHHYCLWLHLRIDFQLCDAWSGALSLESCSISQGFSLIIQIRARYRRNFFRVYSSRDMCTQLLVVTTVGSSFDHLKWIFNFFSLFWAPFLPCTFYRIQLLFDFLFAYSHFLQFKQCVFFLTFICNSMFDTLIRCGASRTLSLFERRNDFC